MKILIVKTSSLGDIIQCFPVLNYLHHLFPDVEIDWVVEKHFAPVVQAHPLIHRAIPLSLKNNGSSLLASVKDLRKESYDTIFDLQGNCKSGLITMLSRGSRKIGFAYSSVREWPNILATDIRFSVSKEINIRRQYLSILEQYYTEDNSKIGSWSAPKCRKSPEESGGSIASIQPSPPSGDFRRFGADQEPKKGVSPYGVQFKISASEKSAISSFGKGFVMVCPGSKWANKQLKGETLRAFLHLLYLQYNMRFLFVWGSPEEKEYCEKIQAEFSESIVLPGRLNIPTWQYLMNEMDLLIAVDSSALHLCGTTKTPSFSIFGPTASTVFKPLGAQHYSIQGKCPYGRTFLKQCPILRSCPTGACIREITAESLLQEFSAWWRELQNSL